VLLTSVDIEEISMLRQMPEFKPRWDMEHSDNDETPGFQGTFVLPGLSPIAVYRPFWSERGTRESFLCLLGFHEVGNLWTLPPEEIGEKPTEDESFQIEVIDLNSDVAERKHILDGNPDWLKKEAQPENILKANVLLKIKSRIALDLRNATHAGYKIGLPKESIGEAV
jgi:hypothetical protein